MYYPNMSLHHIITHSYHVYMLHVSDTPTGTLTTGSVLLTNTTREETRGYICRAPPTPSQGGDPPL